MSSSFPSMREDDWDSDWDEEEISFREFTNIMLSSPGKHRKTRNDLDVAETSRAFCETDLEAKKTYASYLDTQINLAKERLNESPPQDSEKAGSFEPVTPASLTSRDDEFAQLVSGLTISASDRTTHGNASKSGSRRLAPIIPWNPLERFISSPRRHIETQALLEESKRDMDSLEAQLTEQDSEVGDRSHELNQLWTEIRRLEENGKVSTGSTEAGFPEKEAKQG
ncbi:hypothetical protein B9479_004338 [Cryptococcus floricola]|uniref:Uncharacterized protein n=1 Tax=Cryptococcus floricola TaxID=2591691 RepID=A0A5D3AU81_9TREE|nr:hypothetical protein B9479_004338 [Cryptococcus floricola]